MCGACNDHCTQGLAVSELVRAAMYAEGYGEMSVARSHFNAIAAPQRHMSCRDCAYCTVACPNGVVFQDRIVRAIDLLS